MYVYTYICIYTYLCIVYSGKQPCNRVIRCKCIQNGKGGLRKGGKTNAQISISIILSKGIMKCHTHLFSAPPFYSGKQHMRFIGTI